MKIKHIILLIMSLIYFNDMMAEESPITIHSANYDYTIEPYSNEGFYARGTFSMSFDLQDTDCCLIDYYEFPGTHIIVRALIYRDEDTGLFNHTVDEAYHKGSFIIASRFLDTGSDKRHDDYPIYVRDYLSPEDYKLIYGGAGVEGIGDDVEDVSLTQASDAVTIKSGNSDLQEVRVCDMTGKSILAVPAFGNSSEISIDRTRLAKGLNILSVFRQDSPTKSFKILN